MMPQISYATLDRAPALWKLDRPSDAGVLMGQSPAQTPGSSSAQISAKAKSQQKATPSPGILAQMLTHTPSLGEEPSVTLPASGGKLPLPPVAPASPLCLWVLIFYGLHSWDFGPTFIQFDLTLTELHPQRPYF